MLCLLPTSDGVVTGLPGIIGITTGAVHDVLVLPTNAVAGSANHGLVSLVDAAGTREVAVGLGLSDGVSVEITSGVSEGDLVLPYGPGLRQVVAP